MNYFGEFSSFKCHLFIKLNSILIEEKCLKEKASNYFNKMQFKTDLTEVS